MSKFKSRQEEYDFYFQEVEKLFCTHSHQEQCEKEGVDPTGDKVDIITEVLVKYLVKVEMEGFLTQGYPNYITDHLEIMIPDALACEREIKGLCQK